MSKHRPSRRQVVIAAAATAAASGCFPDVGGLWPSVDESCRPEGEGPVAPDSSRVSEVYRADSVRVDEATGRVELNAPAVEAMVEAALAALVPSGAPVWRTLLPDVTPSTRVGLKVNALNEQCATSVPLVRALVGSLRRELSLPAEQVIVWDRRQDELTRCGFTSEAVGATVLGTLRSTEDPSGPGYGEPRCGAVFGKTPRLSRILTDLTDVNVNVPVLKTHAICGVTAALKNIYGLIDNPGDYHSNLNSALPQLYLLPPIRRSFRLAVLDALVAVTTGGTSSPADDVPRRVLASQDALSLDRQALALVDRLRAERPTPLPGVDRAAMGWMEKAAELKLGAPRHELKAITL